MDRYLAMSMVVETIFGNLVENLVEKHNCLLEIFFAFIRHLQFQFDSSIHIHILHCIGNIYDD